MKASHFGIVNVVVLCALFLAGCGPDKKDNQDAFTWEQSNPQAERQTFIEAHYPHIRIEAHTHSS